MTNRELLEWAAKAMFGDFANQMLESGWDPLTNDGDALRLAVKGLNWPNGGNAFQNAVTAMYAVGQLPKDPYVATRQAIVRAAAEIGRSMK